MRRLAQAQNALGNPNQINRHGPARRNTGYLPSQGDGVSANVQRVVFGSGQVADP